MQRPGKGIDRTTGVRRETRGEKRGIGASSGSRGGLRPRWWAGGEKPPAASYAPGRIPNPTPPAARRSSRSAPSSGLARGGDQHRARSGSSPPHVGVRRPAGRGRDDPRVRRHRRPVRDPPRRVSGQRADQARGAARARHDQPAASSTGSRAARTCPRGRSGSAPARPRTCRWRCRSRRSEQRASEIAGEGRPYRVEVQARPDDAGARRLRASALGRRGRGARPTRRSRASRSTSPTSPTPSRSPPRTACGCGSSGRRAGAIVNAGMPRRGRDPHVPRHVRARLRRPAGAADAAGAAGRRCPARPPPDGARRRLAAYDAAAPVDVRRLRRGALAGAVQRHRARPSSCRSTSSSTGSCCRSSSRRGRSRSLVGGRLAPRLRPTWIHAGVGAFVTVAFLSVVVDARDLNRTLELEGSIKQLPLLIAYVSLFLIAASGVRQTEVRAVPEVHARPRGHLRARRHLGVPVQAEPLLRVVGQAAPGDLRASRSSTRAPSTTSAGGSCAARPRCRSRPSRCSSMALPIALVWLMHASALARPHPLRPGRLHPARGRVRDVPQERAAGARSR